MSTRMRLTTRTKSNLVDHKEVCSVPETETDRHCFRIPNSD